MSEPDDTKRCPECKSENLRFVSTRDVRNPRNGPNGPVLARTVHIQCRQCKGSWDVTRRVTE